MFKKAVHFIKTIVFTCFGVLGSYALLAVLLSWFSTSPDAVDCSKSKEIFITTNGFHLDIVLPKKILSDSLRTRLHLSESAQYIAFGWGDKGFYLDTPTWDDLTVATVANAMFVNSETAMHLITYRRTSSSWRSVKLCPKQLEVLQSYIFDSFERDKEGEFIQIVGEGYTSRDFFYEARGSYNGIQTCNFWVNKGLKTAGVKTSVWSPSDRGVLYHLDNQ